MYCVTLFWEREFLIFLFTTYNFEDDSPETVERLRKKVAERRLLDPAISIQASYNESKCFFEHLRKGEPVTIYPLSIYDNPGSNQ